MPLYQHKCGHCGNVFEIRRGFDAPAEAPCPGCGQPAPRVIFPTPHMFKGRLASRAFGGKDKMQDGQMLPRHHGRGG